MLLPIEEIEVGERRREDYGDLAELAASIRKYGMIHPIVLDAENRLVAGGRRLAACEILGWAKVPVRLLGELTEAERREIELEENLRRKDLTEYERSRTIVALVETAKEIAKTCPTVGQVSKPARGPTRTPGSQRDIETRTGISDTTADRAEQHVATAEAIPALQGPEWKQSYVLSLRENLESLPEMDREPALAMASESFVIPKKAVRILESLAEKTPEERSKIFELHQSGDERKHDAAMALAISGRVFPDLRAASLKTVIDELKGCIKMFPEDALVPKFRAAIDRLSSLKLEVEQLHQERINGSTIA